MQWFNCFQLQVEKHGIHEEDIWNFDKTGFRIGQCREVTIFARYPARNNGIASASERTLLSSIECVNSVRDKIPPMLILLGKTHLEDWYTHTRLPHDYILDVSDTAYSNERIAYSWIHHFSHCTVSKRRGAYRLILMDDHEPYLTVELVKYCQYHNILLPSFPSHLTHRLQPLDSIPFQQLKERHSAAANEASQIQGERYNKLELLFDIHAIREKALTPRAIRKGWQETGIR
jgi:hypothetical protein